MFNRLFLIFFTCATVFCSGSSQHIDSLLKRGWAALVRDDDSAAITCFEQAYKKSLKAGEPGDIAESLLNLGICYYGKSQNLGLEYCFSSMAYFAKLEKTDPQKALNGRSRCLQLASTIYGRQGKYRKALLLSREALGGFPEKDSSGYRGLAYSSISRAYEQLHDDDSSEFYSRQALAAQQLGRNFVYLPLAYIRVANVELKQENRTHSSLLYNRAYQIADSTGNIQAQVSALVGIGQWQLKFGTADSAGRAYEQAKKLAQGLGDRAFYLLVLEQIIGLRKQQNNYKEATVLQDEIATVRDSINSFDQRRLAKSLETRFNVAEKDRKLLLLQNERDLSRLSNYLLWTTICFVLLLSAGIIVFLRRVNSRDRALLQTREELMKALEEQKSIREKYLQNELEHRESQLSAMAFQIMQKNELMQELKQQVDENKAPAGNEAFHKIINKGLSHEKEWEDFNVYFESINKNFYTRLKDLYPGISPNDLKLAALIKLNLSIKEMSVMLNISPDSVKTARYRLRKKLSLTTEDNLTDFILKL